MYKYIWENVFSEVIGLVMLVYERCIKGALQRKSLCFVQVKVFIFVQTNNCIYFIPFPRVSLVYYQAKVEIHTITCKECARFSSTLNRLFLYSSVQYNRN